MNNEFAVLCRFSLRGWRDTMKKLSTGPYSLRRKAYKTLQELRHRCQNCCGAASFTVSLSHTHNVPKVTLYYSFSNFSVTSFLFIFISSLVKTSHLVLSHMILHVFLVHPPCPVQGDQHQSHPAGRALRGLRSRWGGLWMPGLVPPLSFLTVPHPPPRASLIALKKKKKKKST